MVQWDVFQYWTEQSTIAGGRRESGAELSYVAATTRTTEGYLSTAVFFREIDKYSARSSYNYLHLKFPYPFDKFIYIVIVDR